MEKVRKIISEIVEKQEINTVYFVGCGGSLSGFFPAKYFLSEEAKKIIEKYQKHQVEITKKQALKKQLEEFVIPQLPEKQTNVPNEEELRLLVEQQKLIQQRMRTLEEYETTRKYSKLCREQQDKVDMLSLAAKTLDAKVGVKGIHLKKPAQHACRNYRGIPRSNSYTMVA